MNMRDNPNLHLATDNVKNNTFIAVLHFTVIVVSSIMNIAHTL
jgi:hypothetical protein